MYCFKLFKNNIDNRHHDFIKRFYYNLSYFIQAHLSIYI